MKGKIWSLGVNSVLNVTLQGMGRAGIPRSGLWHEGPCPGLLPIGTLGLCTLLRDTFDPLYCHAHKSGVSQREESSGLKVWSCLHSPFQRGMSYCHVGCMAQIPTSPIRPSLPSSSPICGADYTSVLQGAERSWGGAHICTDPLCWLHPEMS